MCFEICCLSVPVSHTWDSSGYVPAPIPVSTPTRIYERVVPGYGLGISKAPMVISPPLFVSNPSTVNGRVVPGYGVGVPVTPSYVRSPSLSHRVAPITPANRSYATAKRVQPGTRVFNAPSASPMHHLPGHQFSSNANLDGRVAVGRRA
jgi:hypothetical protein